jgi:hypothetical protein
LLIGCQGEADQQRRAEAGRVSRAIDVLRRAPNRQKQPRLLALKAEPCTFDDVCQLKSVCVEAYERHIKSVESSRVARRALEQSKAGDGDKDVQAAKLVAQSKQQLEQSKKLMSGCLAAQGTLRRRLDL